MLARAWQICFAVGYGIAVLVCFICDLAVCHRLDWFWIVLTSLMLAFCFTNLPFLVRKDRSVICLGAATGSLALLLLSCWLYTGGAWVLGGLAITAASLALPWGIWALWRFYGNHLPPLIMAMFSAWLFALLGVIQIFTGGRWLLLPACPIAALALLFLWAGFAVVYWLPTDRWGKAGLLVLLTALAMPAGQGLALWLYPGNIVPVVDYFAPWQLMEVQQPGWANLLLFIALLALSASLFAVGAARKLKRR